VVRYLLLNYCAGAHGNVRSALVRLAAQWWQNVDSMAGSLGSRPGSGSQEEARPGNSTPIARQGVKREASKEPANWRQRRRGNGEELTAPRSPFYEPRAKGGVMTQSDVTQILFLYWATAALGMPCQAPGPETASVAHLSRHG